MYFTKYKLTISKVKIFLIKMHVLIEFHVCILLTIFAV